MGRCFRGPTGVLTVACPRVRCRAPPASKQRCNSMSTAFSPEHWGLVEPHVTALIESATVKEKPEFRPFLRSTLVRAAASDTRYGTSCSCHFASIILRTHSRCSVYRARSTNTRESECQVRKLLDLVASAHRQESLPPKLIEITCKLVIKSPEGR